MTWRNPAIALALASFAAASPVRAETAAGIPSPPSDKVSRSESDSVQGRNRAIEVEILRYRSQDSIRYAAAQRILALDGDSSDCLAEHVRRRACLLTVGEFNRFARGMEPDEDLGRQDGRARGRVREIRQDMLRLLLRPDFLQDRLAATGLMEQVLDTAEKEERRIWSGARKQWGEGYLRALYERHKHYFAAREARRYEVFASTDSAWVDSAYAFAVKRRQASESRPAAREDPPHSSAGSGWTNLPDSALPAELAAAGRLLRQWRYSKPIAWKGGYAALRPIEIGKSPGLPYENAIPSLVCLASMPHPDSLRAIREARAYYLANPKEFAKPDTLILEIALRPGPDTGSSRPVPMRRISSTDLPPDIRAWLESRDSLARGASFGPVALGMGTWTLRIAELKRGRGTIPFADVKAALVLKLARKHEADALSRVARDLADKRRDRGMRIFEELLDKRDAPSPAEIAAAVDGDPDAARGLPPGIPDSLKRANLEFLAERRLIEERRIRDFASWLASSVVLRPM